MDSSLLCDSIVCRLCAEENTNGSLIYPEDENGENLSEIINKYLPLKVYNDGKLPNILCPGCTIQLEATRSFFDLIIDGQKKLKEIYTAQEELLRRQKQQKEQLECALRNVNPNSSVKSYAVHSDEAGEKIFIQILSDGPLFPPDHEMSLKVQTFEKHKKKRGRPPKLLSTEDTKQTLEEDLSMLQVQVKEEEENLIDSNGKRKRKIKKPSKYLDVLEGKELDRVLSEEGVFDEEEHFLANDRKTFDKNLNNVAIKYQMEVASTSAECENEIDTKLQGKDDENLGVLWLNKEVTIDKSTKGKMKFICDICGRLFQHQHRLDLHKSLHKDIYYQCTSCSLSFYSKANFELHQSETAHQNYNLIEYVENYGQLELPKTIEDKVDSLKLEIIDQPSKEAEEKQEKIICGECSKPFSNKHNYEVHLKAVHENAKPYTCSKCNKKFPYLNSYKNHVLQQHRNRTYSCELCSKVFQHPSSLIYHRETEHNNGRKFVCNKCKKCFKHRQLLLRHQLVHSSDRPFSCKDCAATFKTRANMLNHMLTHTGEKKHFCTRCSQTFAHKTSLKLHLRWHDGQKPFECDVCQKRFSQKGNLAEHRRIHTGEKPFACLYCDRKFTTSSQYRLHVKRHTGERPWKCEYCSKTFLHKITWKSHIRRHRNEKPFQCTLCLRRFTEEWSLKKHERLHRGEKPHTCDICEKAFSDSSNLKKHRKIHMKNESGVEKDLKEFDPLSNEQIVYLAYQNDAADPQVDTTANQEIITADSNLDDGTLFTDTEILQGNASDEISIDVQELVDNDGNAISLTTEDGQQIKVFTTMDESQTIQGLLPDGTFIPINLSTQEGKPIAEFISKQQSNDESAAMDLRETEALNGIDIGLGQCGVDSAASNLDTKTKIDFLDDQNQERQNLCFIATYGIDGNVMSSEYININ